MTDALKLAFAGEEIARHLAATFEEPDWLLEERLDAYRRYAELPPETNQLFTTYLDLRAARFAEIEPYKVTGDTTDPSSRPPPGSEALLHVEEDRIVARALSEEARAAGVIVDTFANVLRHSPELLRSLIEGGASLPENDKFAQFARAHAAIGVVVHVPGGVELVRPIVLRWSIGAAGRGLTSRTVISIGDNASASILEEQLSSVAADGPQSLWWGTSEVVLGDGARLSFAAEQDFGPNTLMFVNRQATLGRDAQLQWALASVGSQLQRSRIDNRLVGRGASVQQAEIGFGGGSQLFDLTSYTRHVGQDTTGDLLSKGVFTDRARGFFKGMIDIERSARGTDSFLGEFAMLLSKKARSVAVPSLEIDQPDVRRAAHSSSVGPIDETQVFYLMSRGLPQDLARKYIVLGFLEPVVARIPLPEAQDRLRQLLDAKWPRTAEPTAA